MTKRRILVVDDEEDIQELVRYNLERDGFDVTCVDSGPTALEAVAVAPPDLIVLDLMLPVIDGLEVCRRLKQNDKTAGIPIVMVTAKVEDADIVSGLELGADDYITKPFSPRVLIARIRAVFRRQQESTTNIEKPIVINSLTIDPARRSVTVEEHSIELTATEFSILSFLAQHPGYVFTRNRIILAVKGEGYPVTDRSVDVQIVSLRRKLGATGQLIETVRGVGYRFQER